jgi:lantibiotic transport system permease protein
MIALLRTEWRKLGGSLALLFALCAPALPGLLAVLAMATNQRSPAWASIIGQFALPLWTLFLLPMCLAVFSTLVAQIEYRGRGWDHLLALPIARWRVFTAKALVVLAAVALMSVLMIVFALAGASAGGLLSGRMPVGPLLWASWATHLGQVLVAGLLMTALQLWAAMRFANFVVPLGVGVGGTLVALAVAITQTDQADWFPWVLPFRVAVARDPSAAVAFGGGAGLVVLVAMVIDLSRRSFR